MSIQHSKPPGGSDVPESHPFGALLLFIGFLGLLCWRTLKGALIIWLKVCWWVVVPPDAPHDNAPDWSLGFLRAFNDIYHRLFSALELACKQIDLETIPDRIGTMYTDAMQPGTSYGLMTLAVTGSLAVTYFILHVMR